MLAKRQFLGEKGVPMSCFQSTGNGAGAGCISLMKRLRWVRNSRSIFCDVRGRIYHILTPGSEAD